MQRALRERFDLRKRVVVDAILGPYTRGVDDLDAFVAELRRRLSDPARAGRDLVVASIVRDRGSTPRKAGAKMLIDPAGPQLGTVGGGCGEAEVVSRAHRVLATGEPQRLEVSLLEEDGWESPSICGGVLDVFLERCGETLGGVPATEIFAALDTARARGLAAALVSITRAPRTHAALLGRKCVVDERGVQRLPFADATIDAAAVEQALRALARGEPSEEALDGGWALFVEPLVTAPELVIVGAGHVGQALARVAPAAGFAVTVLDDRASFANPHRLPEARAIVVADPRTALTELPQRRSRAIVLVTRGHKLDADCLRVALGLDWFYLGMIGSRRRVRRILEHLAGEGLDPDRLARVHAPIGLDIGAETPGEIAVAVVAEIVDVRRRGRATAVSLSRRG
ncbi:XdhC family protein [Candidatus Binatia bacterium]|nr:XdhC family protein [Candidatus Binatia bacterium]